jgi:hypothetical protein
MTVKKSLLVLFAIASMLVVMAVLGACKTTYPVDIEKRYSNILVWDERLPKEESIVLYIPTSIKVTSYNGINVDWSDVAVYLPPGNVTVTIDNKSYTAWPRDFKNRIFQRTFNTGEHYGLYPFYERSIPILTLWNMNEREDWRKAAIGHFQKPPRTVVEPAPGLRINKGMVPTNETTKVVFEGIVMWECNGTYVHDEWYHQGLPLLTTEPIEFPAGGTSLVFDFVISIEGFNKTTIIFAENLEIRYNFEAGKEYTISRYQKRVGLTREYGVEIWDFAAPYGIVGNGAGHTMLQSWKLGEL